MKAMAQHSRLMLGAATILSSIVCSSLTGAYGAEQLSPEATAAATQCSPEQIAANRKLGTAFNQGRRSFEELYAMMSTDYIQHNAIMTRFGDLNGVEGREEFKLLNEMSERGVPGVGPPEPLPGQPPTDSLNLIIADCQSVFVMRKTFVPDPQNKGKFYEAFDWDAWRIKDGKLAEHWDGVRLPAKLPELLTVPVKDLLARQPAGK